MSSESSEINSFKINGLDLLENLPENLEPEPYEALRQLEKAIVNSDHIIIGLGGRHNRLGETIVETGPALEGLLYGLEQKDKKGTKVSIIVDSSISSLLNEQAYKDAFWPEIEIIPANPTRRDGDYTYLETITQQSDKSAIVAFDFNGSNLNPITEINQQASDEQQITYVRNLHWAAIHSFTENGNRRYAKFVETLLRLPEPLNPDLIQPTIRLTRADCLRLPELYEKYGINQNALLVFCGFQASEGAKCYGKWLDVMGEFANYMHEINPDIGIQFLIACGPHDETQPRGFNFEALQQQFGSFSGTDGNASVIVEKGIPLRDLAILSSSYTAEENGYQKPIGLCNDSLLSHLVGAVKSPVVTPYLTHYWTKNVWASSPYHHGVTLPDYLISDPLAIYFFQAGDEVAYGDVMSDIKNGTSIVINRIDSHTLAKEAIKCLQD